MHAVRTENTFTVMGSDLLPVLVGDNQVGSFGSIRLRCAEEIPTREANFRWENWSPWVSNLASLIPKMYYPNSPSTVSNLGVSPDLNTNARSSPLNPIPTLAPVACKKTGLDQLHKYFPGALHSPTIKASPGPEKPARTAWERQSVLYARFIDARWEELTRDVQR